MNLNIRNTVRIVFDVHPCWSELVDKHCKANGISKHELFRRLLFSLEQSNSKTLLDVQTPTRLYESGWR